MNRIVGFFLLFLLFAAGCKSRKTIENNNESFNYDYFSSKIKVHYKDENASHSFAVNYRSKRDSICWGSISIPPGLEVARFQITQDSVQILNKFKKEYYAYGIKKLEETTGYDLDLSILQNILMGKLPLSEADKQNFRKKKDEIIITQHLSNVIILNVFDKETKLMQSMHLSSEESSSEIIVNYSDYGKDSGVNLFPEKQIFSGVVSNKDGVIKPEISLHYTRIEFTETPLKFPFNVSSKYTKK